ncbi:MAG: hypothetical protein CHACPFDD_00723 [Phycisphaerae bacterium]|nr:hypothetical protein [Phycisphaerae bacterium]
MEVELEEPHRTSSATSPRPARRGPPAAGATVVIRRPAQWDALLAPVRVELIEFLKLIGPSSVAQLARHMGRAPRSLYYHVGRLMAAGVVEVAGYRRGRRVPETVYRLVAPRFEFDYDPATGRNAVWLKKLSAAVLRMADRTFRSAVDSRLLRTQPGELNVYSRRISSWLTPVDFRAIRARIREIESILERGQVRRRGVLYSMTAYLTPVVRRRVFVRSDGS